MRFKKLELVGFKSFADQTTLTFEPGVTAIVGPNGCGKSNISDAIKWVLGEQSARELRGGRMEDLIFSGSESRPAVSYAEVSLTLDNADKKFPLDYSEITISRRLFRSGESDYLLNQTPVRLKDITELLMGTGIGTSAYSLFEQGRIEQIITSHPEDRRVIFEEAAGITKFKSQKKEALRKLGETQHNLARVGDIIAEIKKQIHSLERQARRAEQYREQMEELKKCEVRAARYTQGQLSSAQQEKETARRTLQIQLGELENQQNAQDSSLQQARERVTREEEAAMAARENLSAITHQKEVIDERVYGLAERMEEAAVSRAQFEQDIVELQEQLIQLTGQREDLSSLVEQSDAHRRAKEEKAAAARTRLEEASRRILDAHQTMSHTQEQMMEQTAAEVGVKNQWTQSNQEIARLEARLHRLQTEQEKSSVKHEEKRLQIHTLECALIEVRQKWQELSGRQQAQETQVDSTHDALIHLKDQKNSLEQEQARCESQIQLLQGLVAAHEGYSTGIKALCAAFDQGRLSREGVNGLLAELIQVGQEDSAAVDAALGPWSQAVVVDSMAVVERCRQFLEETKSGKVLFLIRDQIPQAHEVRENQVVPEGGIPLFDRIGVTPHLEPLLKILLADTWLVENRETAYQWAHKISSPTGRVVTRSGEWVSRSSARLGPSGEGEFLVVGRTTRLQSVEAAFAHGQTQLEETGQRLESIQMDYTAKSDALTTIESTLGIQTQELHRLEASLASVQGIFTQLKAEQDIVTIEKIQLEEELDQVRTRIGNYDQELLLKRGDIAELEKKIQLCRHEITSAAEDREKAAVALASLEAEYASFDHVLTTRRSSLQVLEQSIHHSETKKRSCVQEKERLEQAVSAWGQTKERLLTDLLTLEGKEEEGRPQAAHIEQKKSQTLEELKAYEKEWMVLGRQAEQLRSQLHALDMEQAQLNFQMEQMLNRLSQIYQLNLNEVPQDMTPLAGDEEMAETHTRIQELSEKVQRIGPVNLSSIDEEKELKDRYEFLVNQQNDLTKAQEDLHEVITKINRTTRALFRETFEAIQKEFQSTFRQLFGGGEARLLLLDEEDVLESGIEIIARPPGKPLQAITLLSGGEKALTSIALLFAIFRVKPSPFCLLDEMDAPLDESNVDRFTKALKEFLKESQFIIITHNKRTMAMADILYGVTMPESGVSRIVSVKLSNSNGNGVDAAAPDAGQVVEAAESSAG